MKPSTTPLATNPTWSPLDFRVLDQSRSHRALALLNTPDRTTVSLNDYKQAIDNLPDSLDEKILQPRRVEQSYLRRSLFASTTEADCAICGRRLPVDLLVAAHIKTRSECTRNEKLDVENIIMAACKLGCDEMYERGYIAVNSTGIILATNLPTSTDLSPILGVLKGRTCTAHRASTANYFETNLQAVFRR